MSLEGLGLSALSRSSPVSGGRLEQMVRFFLLCLLALPTCWGDDAPCDARLTKLVGERGATIKVCIQTERLIPNRPVIFAVLNFDEQSEHFGNRVLVLDVQAATAGRRQIVFEDRAGIDLLPFLFCGRKTLAAISDFDRSGRIAWAIVRLSDTGSALDIRCWDPSAGAFRPVGPWARNEDEWYQQKTFSVEEELHGMVEVNDGEIRLPTANPVTYKLDGSRFVKAAPVAQRPAAAAVCGKRETCRMVASKPAGTAPTASALTVVEVRLGLKDKTDDAPDEGCRDGNGGYNGGTEYWLLAPPAPPDRLLALCNDGYGAAGVGEDRVEIGNNRLTYTQVGGSNDRWETSRVMQLSPRRALSIDSCSYRATTPGSGVAMHAEITAMKVQSVAQDDRHPAMANDGPGCPSVKGFWNPQPGPGLMAGLALPIAAENGSSEYPSGIPLGSCAVRLGTPDTPGFNVYGTPLLQRGAELRIIALDRHTLVLQLHDPQPAAAGVNWVQSDHLEIWTGKDISGMHNRPDPADIAQVGIGLDGKVYAGLGKPALPAVKHTEARDEAGRPVHVLEVRWKDENALAAGVVVAYSQAEGGRQSYVFSTAGIVRNRPLYLPALAELPVSCGVADGRWSVTGNSGKLE